MKYRDYLIRRFLFIIPTLIGLSLLIFAISRVMPGDPARMALGPEATEAMVEAYKERMGLNDPLWKQYVNYIWGLMHLDLGEAFQTKRHVLDDLRERFPASFELTTVAMLFAIAIGVPLGVRSGINKDKWQDHSSRVVAFVGVSMPRFWVGLMLQIFMATILIRWFRWPIIGRIPAKISRYGRPHHITGLFLVDSMLTLDFEAFFWTLIHMSLPMLTLSLATIAQLTRITRAGMIEETRKDYIIAARALGLPENLIVNKYMLKNAFTSTLTIIGLTYGFLLGQAFMVEYVFTWPGLGTYGIKSIQFNDFNAIVGLTLLIGMTYLLVNFVVDMFYGYLDPRIKYLEEK
ncbi:MAG: ABC transporter permease [Candidatus Heimdallarchaeota archaeon]